MTIGGGGLDAYTPSRSATLEDDVNPRTLFIALCFSLLSLSARAEPKFVQDPIDGKILTFQLLDVGQGDAIYIETPDGKRMLIDAGPQGAKNEILEFLAAKGIKKLDLIMVTHGHADHVGKLNKVLKAVEVGAVVSSGFFHPTGLNEDILATMKEKSIPMKVVAAGDRFKLGDSVEFRVIYPEKDAALSVISVNDTSLLVKMTFGEVSFVLTGDAEHFTEEIVLKTHAKELDGDILKVGHHGSETASSNPFLDAVTPKVAIISCGENNKFSHPHKSALDRFSERGIRMFRTDLDGTLTITTDGKKVRIETGKKASVSTLFLFVGKAA